MRRLPKYVRVVYRGIPHVLDLVVCRYALVTCQVEGELESMESLAAKVNVSRSTASRFFSGRQTSLTVTLKILDALHLTFEEWRPRVWTSRPTRGTWPDACRARVPVRPTGPWLPRAPAKPLRVGAGGA